MKYNTRHEAHYLCNELDECTPEREATLKEPHGNHVVGQRYNVVVELEGIGVGDSNGKDGHVLL